MCRTCKSRLAARHEWQGGQAELGTILSVAASVALAPRHRRRQQSAQEGYSEGPRIVQSSEEDVRIRDGHR